MSEVKDPAIKLFGRTISLPLNEPFSVAPPQAPHPSSSSSASQHETEEQSRKELTLVQDNDGSHQTTEEPKTPSSERENSLLKSSNNEEQSETSVSQDKSPKKPDKILPCPRCNSMDTKFCYYNNYNVNQPRHFCKNCQRYWTAGGTMRNVPVGAGRRKNKNTNISASPYRPIMVSEALQAANGLHNSILAFGGVGPDSPLCNSMSSVLNIADHHKVPPNRVLNGFHAPVPSNYDGNDHSIGVSGSTPSALSNSESMDHKRIQGFPTQLTYFPYPPPWNSAAPPPPPAFCPPGFPVSFYTTPSPYWSCVGPSWNVPNVSSPISGPNSPLGKHSRDGSVIMKPDFEHNINYDPSNNHNNNVLIPKTLRIDDPSEAARSSIWSTLGIKNDINRGGGGGGLFKAFQFQSKDKDHSAVEAASPALHANPAALSRSFTFHERT